MLIVKANIEKFEESLDRTRKHGEALDEELKSLVAKRISFVLPATQPSVQPSSQQSVLPSVQPSSQPSVLPATQSSVQPRSQPSVLPATQPSVQPSLGFKRKRGRPRKYDISVRARAQDTHIPTVIYFPPSPRSDDDLDK